jgi:hypothetical protein
MMMMKAVHWFVLLGALAGCGTSPAIGTSRIADDASVSIGGKPSSMGSGGARSSTGGASSDPDASLPTPDARASAADAGPCVTESVSHVARSSTLGVGIPAGTGGFPPTSGADAGPRLFSGLPVDPCGNHGVPNCVTAPRAIFDCPEVRGPTGGDAVHPGDPIVVTVPITDLGLAAYSCEGIVADQPLGMQSVLLYAVMPGYVKLSGQVPLETKPGTVIHFSAEASGAHTATACSNDLNRLDFDVTVE